jgi:hypothetical protein
MGRMVVVHKQTFHGTAGQMYRGLAVFRALEIRNLPVAPVIRRRFPGPRQGRHE